MEVGEGQFLEGLRSSWGTLLRSLRYTESWVKPELAWTTEKKKNQWKEARPSHKKGIRISYTLSFFPS